MAKQTAEQTETAEQEVEQQEHITIKIDRKEHKYYGSAEDLAAQCSDYVFCRQAGLWFNSVEGILTFIPAHRIEEIKTTQAVANEIMRDRPRRSINPLV